MCRKNQNTHFVLDIFVSKLVPFDIMSKNVVDADRHQVTTQQGAEKSRFACRITTARILTLLAAFLL